MNDVMNTPLGWVVIAGVAVTAIFWYGIIAGFAEDFGWPKTIGFILLFLVFVYAFGGSGGFSQDNYHTGSCGYLNVCN